MVQLLLATSSLFVMVKARSLVEFRFVHSVYKPIIATIIMIITMLTLMSLLPVTYVSLALSITVGSFMYLGVLFFIFNVNPLTEVKSLLHHE